MVSTGPLYVASRYRPWYRTHLWSMVMLLALCSNSHLVQGQTFDSGSTGADGALNLTTPGTVIFDPVALRLDPEGDSVFHFTTITIGPGVTVHLSAQHLNGPVVWLASGAVQIDGVINLNGQDGQSAQDIVSDLRFPAVPGPGGFGGGLGRTPFSTQSAGYGPGGGQAGNGGGGGGGYAAAGGNAGAGGSFSAFGGVPYGNNFLVPLVGGSGGGGGSAVSDIGGSGGAGGGALLLASSTSITVNGAIQANGGKGGNSSTSSVFDGGGGGGSGGAIHLLSPIISLTGTLSGVGGARGSGGNPSTVSGGDDGGVGSSGRIRVEAFQRQIIGTITPPPCLLPPLNFS